MVKSIGGEIIGVIKGYDNYGEERKGEEERKEIKFLSCE